MEELSEACQSLGFRGVVSEGWCGSFRPHFGRGAGVQGLGSFGGRSFTSVSEFRVQAGVQKHFAVFLEVLSEACVPEFGLMRVQALGGGGFFEWVVRV